jgi:fibronectin-binding autotransporter adhesin
MALSFPHPGCFARGLLPAAVAATLTATLAPAAVGAPPAPPQPPPGAAPAAPPIAGAPTPPPPQKQKAQKGPQPGGLRQLGGGRGCLVDRSKAVKGCGQARALQGPGPFMGSRAIALSPDGQNVYVAASKSDAIAIFRRDAPSGALTQPQGAAGCVAAKAADGCAKAIGLDGPNSVAVSADGRNVYATSRTANSITVFRRDAKSGALTQLPGAAGCIAGAPLPGCAAGRALLGPDVVTLSPDGANAYVGSFFGNEVAVFARNGDGGALTQPGGSNGCIAETTSSGCASAIALGAPEGMAVSPSGAWVYVTSALSNGVAVLARDPTTGALSQARDGSGCIVDTALSGCTTGFELGGANAAATAPNGDLYVTSLFSNSVDSFARSTPAAALAQLTGPSGCLVYLRAVGCSFGRALSAPEGVVVSPDGRNVYAAAFTSGAIVVADRNRSTGAIAQKPNLAGCLAAPSVPGCQRAKALRGVSSLALSPDGRFLYSTSFGSNAVDIFRRNK